MLWAVGCRISGIPDCVIGRVDLAQTDGGYKLLEFNADAPGLIVEAFSVNGRVCRDAGSGDPNSASGGRFRRALASSVRAGFQYVETEPQRGNVVVTSGGGPRDMAQANYVCKLLPDFSAEYIPVKSLRISEEGIFDLAGRRIDVLYRSFPLQRDVRGRWLRPCRASAKGCSSRTRSRPAPAWKKRIGILREARVE